MIMMESEWMQPVCLVFLVCLVYLVEPDRPHTKWTAFLSVLLGGWGRLDDAVGRQFRASQVGGEERLNLAAQCVLNFIRRFSGIDHLEVKLFCHFIELLDEE